MRLALICSEEYRDAIGEVLRARKIAVDPDSEVRLVERGADVPTGGIAIVFDPARADELAAFLDSFGQAEAAVRDHFILAKGANSYELIQYEDIAFFQASGNYTFCQTAQKKYEVRKKLYELERALWPQGFVRVNKSFIVNLLMIQEIIPWFGERLLLKLKAVPTEIEVSRSYVRTFKSAINM